MGYLNLVRAFLCVCCFLCSSWELAQPALALCVRVLNTLYFTGR